MVLTAALDLRVVASTTLRCRPLAFHSHFAWREFWKSGGLSGYPVSDRKPKVDGDVVADEQLGELPGGSYL